MNILAYFRIYRIRDDVSGIKRVEFGLGSSPRNTYILDYVDVTNFTHPSYHFKVPDGKATWIKNRVTNNGKLLNKLILNILLNI